MWFCVVCVLGKTVISDKTLAKKQNDIYWGQFTETHYINGNVQEIKNIEKVMCQKYQTTKVTFMRTK